MLGFLKSLFLDEKARKALDKAKARPAAAAKPKPPATPPMTPQRAKLIADAMAVHKAKRRILDDLSDEARAQLVAMAITALMRETADPAKPPPGKGKKTNAR